MLIETRSKSNHSCRPRIITANEIALCELITPLHLFPRSTSHVRLNIPMDSSVSLVGERCCYGVVAEWGSSGFGSRFSCSADDRAAGKAALKPWLKFEQGSRLVRGRWEARKQASRASNRDQRKCKSRAGSFIRLINRRELLASTIRMNLLPISSNILN